MYFMYRNDPYFHIGYATKNILGCPLQIVLYPHREYLLWIRFCEILVIRNRGIDFGGKFCLRSYIASTSEVV